jgi:hypothetical protein
MLHDGDKPSAPAKSLEAAIQPPHTPRQPGKGRNTRMSSYPHLSGTSVALTLTEIRRQLSRSVSAGSELARHTRLKENGREDTQCQVSTSPVDPDDIPVEGIMGRF